MAEIPVEKKSSLTWLWVLLGLIILALLIWWAVDDDEEEYIEPVATEAAAPVAADATVATGATIPTILQNPQQYIGQDNFSGTYTVASVETDRGFWIQDDQNNRIFALIDDGPQEVPMDINNGQTLRITSATVRGPSDVGTLRGDPLDQNTQNIVDGQQAFLAIPEENMQIVEEGTGNP